jgi:tetratricopeptide (TPR) repeat protein
MTRYCSVFLFLLLLAGLTLPMSAASAPQSGRALFSLGVFAYENGDYKTAEDYLKKAISFDDSDAYVNYYLGNVYLKTGDYNRAAVFFDKAVSLDKNLPDLAYNWAYVNYLLNNFEVSGQLFEALSKSEPENVLAHYYAGLAFYQQGRYETALAYLDHAARMDTPASCNADYHAALCDLRLKNIVSAETRLTRVQQDAAEADLRRAAADLLEKIRRGEGPRNRYSLVAKAGWEYDDNEVLEPIDDNDLFAGKSDHMFTGYLSATYDVIRTDKFILGAGYSHYLTLHDKIEEYDLSASMFDLYARYRRNAYTYTLEYDPDYYWLDSESYLCRHEFRFIVSRQFENILGELSCIHKRDNNMYDADRDGYANEIFFRCRYTLPDDKGTLRAGAGYEVNSAEHRDYDYDKISTELAAAFDIGWGVYCSFSGEYELQQYDNVDSTYGKKREDDKFTGNILFSRNIFNEMIAAHIGYEYIRNNSNIDDFSRFNANYEYESNAVKVFLTVTI